MIGRLAPRGRLWTGLIVGAAGLVAPVVGGSRLAAQRTASPPAPVWTTITYLSGATVYLEVGARQGVREGTPLQVVRGGATIAELTAKYVSSSRAACTIAASTLAPAVGDSVRFVPAADTTVPSTSSVATSSARRLPAARSSRIRGRLGVRYLIIDQGAAGTLRQPSVDVRLDGTQVAGTALGLAVDIRTQRTTMSGGTTPSAAGLTRVYQLAMTVQPHAGVAHWSLGRQFATALSPIGIFDGAALDLNLGRWSAGGLAGTQPDIATFAPSGATTEYGLWVQRHNAPGSSAPWSATAGAIGSYTGGEINREFVYLRGTYTSRFLSLYAAQEIDANRGWRRVVEGAPATFTSTFVTAQASLGRAVTMSAGLDSRRNVRLYRDFLNPEIAFDDAQRQGRWGELSWRVSGHLRMSTDVRSSDGGSEGGSHAVTASLTATRLTRLGLGVRARSTRYAGPGGTGELTSIALEAAPASAWRASFSGGLRTSSAPGAGTPSTRLTWAGFDLDLAIGRSVYLLLSTYQESGVPAASRQAYAALSWRF